MTYEECPNCGLDDQPLQMHHNSYSDKGYSFRMLCKFCHADFHECHYYDWHEGVFKKRERRIPIDWMDGKVLSNYRLDDFGGMEKVR